MNAAKALWSFTQILLQEFPEYKPNDNGMSLWAESYGPRYRLAFAAVSEEQNKKIRDGTQKQLLLNSTQWGL